MNNFNNTNQTGPLDFQRGFSLVEVMIGMSLMVIVSTLVVPSFYSMLERNRVAQQTNQMIGSLARARNEAIARGQRVSMCPRRPVPLNQVTACTTNSTQSDCLCDFDGAWQNGWLSFVDRDQDGVLDRLDGDLLIAAKGPIPHYTIRSESPPADGDPASQVTVGFNPDGTSANGQTQFGLCLSQGEEALIRDYARQIQVGASGGSRVLRPADSQSISQICKR